MPVKSVQIRVSLPTDLVKVLQKKADRLGLSVSAYLKFLMIADVKDDLSLIPQSRPKKT